MKEERGSVFKFGKCKLQVCHPCTMTVSHPGCGLRLVSAAVFQGEELQCFPHEDHG